MTSFPSSAETAAPAPASQRDDDIALVMQAALEHHRKQEFEEAAALYGVIVDAASNHANAHYHLGVLHMQTGRPDEAVPHFEFALGGAPNNAQVWIDYVNALVESHQIEAARIALDLAQQRGAHGAAVDRLIGRLAR